MEQGDGRNPVDAVVGNQDLVAEIIQRVGSSLAMLRCSSVDTTWLHATRTPTFSARFAERNTPANLGFLVEFQHEDGRVMRLLYAHPSEGDDTADALCPRIVPELLAGDNVLGSRDGIIILLIPEDLGPTAHVYYTSCPSRNPRVYTPVGTRIPAIPVNPDQYTSNTFGQFGVLPGAGPSGMSFFVKAPAGPFNSTYAGVSFSSTANVFVHVSVFGVASWNRSVSPPYPSPEPALFHRNPYSVLEGGRLYMMYVVGYIVCLDLATSTFSQIPLPADLSDHVTSWYDYTVARHSGGGIVLVNYRQGMLDTWVLSHLTDGVDWTLESSLDLVSKLENRISLWTWERVFCREEFPIGQDNFYSVQVKTASSNGRFVFLTFGFDDRMFEVDAMNETVRVINAHRDGMMGRVYTLSEEWPPKQGY